MCITRNASLKSQRSLNKEPKRCCKVPTVLVSNSAVEPRSRACEMEQALWGAGKADPVRSALTCVVQLSPEVSRPEASHHGWHIIEL
jgi:hypothetical protein